MIVKIADTIISPLGCSTEENYQAVKAGCSALREYHWLDLPEPFVASLMEGERWKGNDVLTRFETLVIGAINQILPQIDFDISSPRVIIILSTTKGNVDLLEGREGTPGDSSPYPGETARKIAAHFGNPNRPIVVSNACISGLCAQIAAVRALESGRYDYAVVVGADVQSRFIISGFQSFKALSPEPCKPFDAHRLGLNLGEAAAAIVYQRVEKAQSGQWIAGTGAICNDANHISGPSRTGEGSYRALKTVLEDADVDDIAFVNVHGTATLYNDEMESIAIERAGLIDTPVNSLKGYYGHTMGAAGVMEVILSMRAVEDHTILGTKGFDSLGVSKNVKVSSEHRSTDKNSFIKLLSGFGGCNAAMLFTRSAGISHPRKDIHVGISSQIVITPDEVILDGQKLSTTKQGGALLTELYREKINDYPKFFKMDELCKLGFVATELLLQDGGDRHEGTADHAIVLFNRTGSLCNDRNYQKTINDMENFFPSPSLFVYTLPNIVTGEIAIRNHYYGETSFYVIDQDDPALIRSMAEEVILQGRAKSVICGWLDCEDKDHFLARLEVVESL
jgi:3-oxoacyl-[acyl-carrier-protein] synthase-1